ncbi:MAG: alpha-amylase family glycosyl hydrolase [Sellimonas intestinalis]
MILRGRTEGSTTDGPHIHEYLKELNETTFGTDAEIITVGEMSSTSMENRYRYAGKMPHELVHGI